MKQVEFDKAVYTPFTNIVNSTHDVYILVEQIEGMKRFLFRDKQGMITQKVGTFLSSSMSEILKQLEQSGLVPQDDEKQMQLLDSIIEFLKNIPVVKLDFAFEPSITFVSEVNSALCKQIGRKVVLDIYVNQFLVAGANFEYEGKYKEYSLALKIDNFIAEKIAGISK